MKTKSKQLRKSIDRFLSMNLTSDIPECEVTDCKNTAIFYEGGWVKTCEKTSCIESIARRKRSSRLLKFTVGKLTTTEYDLKITQDKLHELCELNRKLIITANLFIDKVKEIGTI